MFDSVTATNFTLAFDNTNLSSQSIENIVVSIDTAGQSNGTLDITGGANATTETAKDAIDSLTAKGWTVTVPDGYVSPYLLDVFSSSAAAYSLRSLSYNTTNVVRVREDAGNTEQDFTAEEITDGTLEAFVGAGNNGYVVTWYDQSGNGNDVIQAIASYQNKIVSSGSTITDGGKPSILINQSISQGLLIAIAASSTQDFFQVHKTNDNQFIILKDSTTTTRYAYAAIDANTSTTLYSNYGTPSLYVNSSAQSPANRDELYTLLSTNSQVLMSSIGGDSSAWTGDFIWGYYSGSNIYNGNVQEIIFYNSDQSANRTGIEQNINNHYAIYAGSPISGLLYDYPGSAAAYSVRQLTIYDNDYKETLVRVRRDSDNAEVDVKADSNYEISLNSNTSAQISLGDWIGSDSGYVATWYDQSGNGFDAAQNLAARQPKIVDAGVLVEENGKPSISFDYVDDYFSITPIAQTSEFSHFVTSKGSGFLYGTGAGGTDYIRYNGYIRISINNISISENTNVDNLQTQTSIIRSNTDLTTIYYNSNTGASSTISGDFNSNTIGGYNNGTILWNGNIQEHIIYSTDQSSNRTGIEQNINNHYAIYAGSPISGLLYDYPNSAAAYSVRQLTIYDNDYKETLVRVRRSSDNAEVDVKADTNYEISLSSLTSDNVSLGDWIGSDSGYVTTWYDQSGNSNDAIQAAASQQPKIVDAGALVMENGKPSLQPIQTIGQPSLIATYTGTSIATTFCVGQFDSSDIIRSAIKGQSSSTYFFTTESDSPATAISLNSGTPSYYKNGVLSTSTQRNQLDSEFSGNQFLLSGTNWESNTWTEIGIAFGEGTSLPWNKYQEIIIYNSDESSNRESIEQNINNHYAIYAGSPVSGLLYDYPSSAAAYSVRQLTIYDNGYKETLVRVRRDSDNAEVDVKADSNYEISLNSNTSAQISLGDWIGSDSGYVATWYDQSGNSNDATQNTASRQPKIVDAGVLVEENGKPAVDFDGVDDGLQIASFDGEQFVIGNSFMASVSSYRGNSDDGFNTIWHIGAVEDAQTSLLVNGYNQVNNRVHAGKFRGSYIFNPAQDSSINTQYLNTLEYDASFELRSNGTLATANINPSADVTADRLSIGAGGSGNNHFLDGLIQEVVFFDSDQSSNRGNIEANINDYYNIYT
jgi:hypothetical protein